MDHLQRSGYPRLVQTAAVTSYTTFCSSLHQSLWAMRHFLLGHLQHSGSCHMTSLRMIWWSCFWKHLIHILSLYMMTDTSWSRAFSIIYQKTFAKKLTGVCPKSCRKGEKEKKKKGNCKTLCAKAQTQKIRDHNHLAGEYRGPADNACNLNYRIDPKKVKTPCIIHNLNGILFLCYSYFHDC